MNAKVRVCRRLSALLAAFATAAGVHAQSGDPLSFAPLAADHWNQAAASHLLRRAAFHGTPAEVEALLELGLEGAVRRLVDFEALDFRLPAPVIPGELFEPPNRRAFRQLSEEERREEFEARRRLERRAFEETRLWWIERLAASPRPFEEKMTLFWHGHFTSGMREVRDAVFMKEQNDFLRRHALANFGDLLAGVSRDRAMLTYLDGRNNSRKQPNENYARELLELFSLGVGAYTEDDVKAAARAFTGWTLDRYGFTFRPADHDPGPKKFLGREGNLNGDDVIAEILEQPACARFLAGRLLSRFLTPEPERKLVENFARVIRQQRFELRPIMRTLFMSQAFYHARYRGALIKSPVELVVGSARAFGLPLHDLPRVERALTGMGQELMQPPNVRGWVGNEAWINTATLFNRYNAVAALLAGDEQPRGRRAPANDEEAAAPEPEAMNMMNATGGLPSTRSRLEPDARQPAFDPAPWVRDHELNTAEQVVDFFAAHLVAVPLADAKREQLVAFLLGRGAKFDPHGRAAAERIRAMVTLLCSTPEYQLN